MSVRVVWWRSLLLSLGTSVFFGIFDRSTASWASRSVFRPDYTSSDTAKVRAKKEENMVLLRVSVIFLISSVNLVYLLSYANVYGKLIAFLIAATDVLTFVVL